MFFGLLVGAALGYFFKPQIDRGLGKLMKRLREDRDNRHYYDDND